MQNEFEHARRAVPAEDRHGPRLALARRTAGHARLGAAVADPGDAHAGLPGFPHFPPKAKRVIYLHMLGAFSQNDTFDYKPMLEKMHGQELPSFGDGQQAAVDDGQGTDVVSDRRTGLRQFKPYGKSGDDGQRCDAARRRHRR